MHVQRETLGEISWWMSGDPAQFATAGAVELVLLDHGAMSQSGVVLLKDVFSNDGLDDFGERKLPSENRQLWSRLFH